MLYLRSASRFILTSLALLGISISSVNSAVMSADDAVFGVGSVTRDDVSGLEWLDLTQSLDLSYTQVTASITSNGLYKGWRHASTAEIGDFFTSAGGTGPYNGSQGSNVTWITELLALWGITAPQTGLDSSLAITGTVDNFGSLLVSGLFDFLDAAQDDFANTASGRFGPLDRGVSVGHALVRVSAVPVPVAIWLFGTALIGLLGFSKRKTSIAI